MKLDGNKGIVVQIKIKLNISNKQELQWVKWFLSLMLRIEGLGKIKNLKNLIKNNEN